MSNQTFFKTRREELNLTQRDVALALGVTTSAVSTWDLGSSTPLPKFWNRLAKILKVDAKKIALAVLDAETSAA